MTVTITREPGHPSHQYDGAAMSWLRVQPVTCNGLLVSRHRALAGLITQSHTASSAGFGRNHETETTTLGRSGQRCYPRVVRWKYVFCPSTKLITTESDAVTSAQQEHAPCVGRRSISRDLGAEPRNSCTGPCGAGATDPLYEAVYAAKLRVDGARSAPDRTYCQRPRMSPRAGEQTIAEGEKLGCEISGRVLFCVRPIFRDCALPVKRTS